MLAYLNFDSLLFFLIGILGGVVESTAGGSGLLVLPTLLFTGLNPTLALGTSKLQYAFGAIVSITRYRQAKLTQLPYLAFYALVSASMGAAGALLLVNTQINFLKFFIPLLLLGVALYFAFSPNENFKKSKPKLSPLLFALGPVAIIAFYDGFLGTGSGSFFMLALAWGLGLSTVAATANTKVIDFSSSLAALLVMLWHGKVAWLPGLLLGMGQMLGAWFGAGLVIKQGSKILKPLIVILTLVMALKLLWEAFN